MQEEAEGFGGTGQQHKDLHMQHGTCRSTSTRGSSCQWGAMAALGCELKQGPQGEALPEPSMPATWLIPLSISGTELAARWKSFMAPPSTHHNNSVWAVNEKAHGLMIRPQRDENA